jgi:hypothetical protein
MNLFRNLARAHCPQSPVRFWGWDATEKAESKIMKSRHTEDKQLQGITLEAVLEKRRLDQALNAKEFAVCAGVSYSTARDWFHSPGFPAFRGVIFWQDFVQWRAGQNGFKSPSLPQRNGDTAAAASKLPPRAAHILLEA